MVRTFEIHLIEVLPRLECILDKKKKLKVPLQVLNSTNASEFCFLFSGTLIITKGLFSCLQVVLQVTIWITASETAVIEVIAICITVF